MRFNEHGHVPAGRLRLAIEWMIDCVEMWEMQPDLDRMEAHAQRVEALARYVSSYAKNQDREEREPGSEFGHL